MSGCTDRLGANLRLLDNRMDMLIRRMDAARDAIRESIEYGDVIGAYDALALYQNLALDFVTLDCDIVLVKIASGTFAISGNDNHENT